jgi:hypothetical protein
MAEVFTCERDRFVMRGENDDELAPQKSCVSSR